MLIVLRHAQSILTVLNTSLPIHQPFIKQRCCTNINNYKRSVERSSSRRSLSQVASIQLADRAARSVCSAIYNRKSGHESNTILWLASENASYVRHLTLVQSFHSFHSFVPLLLLSWLHLYCLVSFVLHSSIHSFVLLSWLSFPSLHALAFTSLHTHTIHDFDPSLCDFDAEVRQ